jgi:hypothetical protein
MWKVVDAFPYPNSFWQTLTPTSMLSVALRDPYTLTPAADISRLSPHTRWKSYRKDESLGVLDGRFHTYSQPLDGMIEVRCTLFTVDLNVAGRQIQFCMKTPTAIPEQVEEATLDYNPNSDVIFFGGKVNLLAKLGEGCDRHRRIF